MRYLARIDALALATTTAFADHHTSNEALGTVQSVS